MLTASPAIAHQKAALGGRTVRSRAARLAAAPKRGMAVTPRARIYENVTETSESSFVPRHGKSNKHTTEGPRPGFDGDLGGRRSSSRSSALRPAATKPSA